MSLIVGLTGTVASGKNFVADIFKKLGAVIFDADKEVHKIFNKNIVVFQQIKKHFPEVICHEKIDRKILGDLVFNNKEKLSLLESIIHPIVKKSREDFIKKANHNRKALVILNIPLLFEKNIHLECHKTIVVIAPKFIQKQRFLKRAKSSNSHFNSDLFVAKFEDILQNQIPNSQKEKLADFVIKNGQNKSFTFKQVIKISNKLSKHGVN